MNTILDLAGALLGFAFRIITSPLLLILYCISGFMFAVHFINKWMGQISFGHLKIGRILPNFHLKRSLHLYRH